MYNSVIKTAINFLNKDIKKKVSFEAIADYLKSNGYSVMFYVPESGNEFIEKYNLSKYSKSVHAFTIRKKDIKIVFISSIVPHEDKLLLLLHETGHIILNHLDRDILTANTRLQDIEADTFAYTVLNPPRRKNAVIISFILILALLSGIAFFSSTKKTISVSSTTDAVEYVYITATGSKYHHRDCKYAKNNSARMELSEADNLFTPCSICNP